MKKLSAMLSPESSWQAVLAPEFKKPYMQSLAKFLADEHGQGSVIYPPQSCVFNAFNSTPFDKVRVVVIGQDPYHGDGQAHGLSFSVAPGITVPPSLKNMFKEIERDLGIVMPNNGCLQSWAEQGVLLLNATLTVAQNQAGSHQGKGWECFTDVVIQSLNDSRDGLIFMLWGGFAQKKGRLIDAKKHVVLSSSHPSPLSAYRGFLGCGHFSKVNECLKGQGEEEIDWRTKE